VEVKKNKTEKSLEAAFAGTQKLGLEGVR